MVSSTKKDMGVNLFLLQLWVHEQMLNILCEKWHKIYFYMLRVASWRFQGDRKKNW